MKGTVRNTVCSLTKNVKRQITDTTIFEIGNVGGYLLQQWNMKKTDKLESGKLTTFLRATESNGPTPKSGATSLSFIGDSFM